MELIAPFSVDICSCPHPVSPSISSLEAPATHPAGPMDGILSDFFHHPLGKGGDKCRADTGHGLLNTWVPLDNTGSWGVGCVPSLSLPVTHWTPLAENLGGRKDKKGRKLFPEPTPELFSALASSSIPNTLDLGIPYYPPATCV